MISLEKRTLGDIVSGNHQAAMILEMHGLDYCCGGRNTLERACRLHQVDMRRVLAELERLQPVPDPVVSHDPLDLIEHIIDRHHAYIRRAIPSIRTHLARAIRAHGSRHPELSEVAYIFNQLAEELLLHLTREERMLFPSIRSIVESIRLREPPKMRNSVQNPIFTMEVQHQHAGDKLAMIRALTFDYEPPDDACTTYRLVDVELQEFERDLHRHVHLENNVLFPRAVSLEAQANRNAYGAPVSGRAEG